MASRCAPLPSILMAYALRAHLAYAIVSRWTVFLDIPADRYVCLSGLAGRALVTIASAEDLALPEQEALQPLLEAGFLRTDAPEPAVCRPPSIAFRSSLPGEMSAPFSLREMLAVVYQMARQRYAAKTSSLHDLIDGFATRKSLCRPRKDDEHHRAIRIATAFDRMSLLLGAHDRCLARSFALARHLTARDVACDLVFGVSMDPFAAHCWVQHDGVILNDHLDHVRTFTPILVL